MLQCKRWRCRAFCLVFQGTLDAVEALLKRHDDFENTLMAQDERLRTFSEMADKLITAEHYESTYIHDRRNQVRAWRLGQRHTISMLEKERSVACSIKRD